MRLNLHGVRYWDVEARMVPVNRETSYVLKPEDAIQYIDENTIGVMVILGSTYNGAFEDVGRMSSLRELPSHSLLLYLIAHPQSTTSKSAPASTFPSTSTPPAVASSRPSRTPNTSGHSTSRA